MRRRFIDPKDQLEEEYRARVVDLQRASGADRKSQRRLRKDARRLRIRYVLVRFKAANW
jgi:hypothetical protein